MKSPFPRQVAYASLFFAVIVAVFSLPVYGQQPTKPAARPAPKAPPRAQAAPQQQSSGNLDIIRIGDKLMIRLTGVPVEDIAVYEETVDNDGLISMPLVGKFRASGTTTTTLKAQIEDAYRSRRIYSSPNISINQSERWVSVTGEVRMPNRVLYSRDLTALGAISGTGGFTDYANKGKVKILRGSQVIFMNAREALRNPTADVPLQAGDKVQVDRSIF